MGFALICGGVIGIERGRKTVEISKFLYNGLNPVSWRTSGDEWCYEYMLHKMGVLALPELYVEVE